MSQQDNVSGPGGDLTMSRQGQDYQQAVDTMDILGMDHIGAAAIANSSQPASHMGRPGDSADGLAPIFPPQNFDVPDISFSNSVIPNADFNQSLLSSAEMYGPSRTLYANVNASSSHIMGTQTAGYSQGQADVGGERAAYFPAASSSPPGTSSSDDSDDLPLAQLAKRVVLSSNAANTGAHASAASPSAPSTDTTSMEGSPTPPGASKKAKPTKRKKKKDPNEPQKPVSAYALFFRDTQATIKGHNPSASFGEVSKIVASMWDQLDPEHKDVYKKKTELAKKQYLKQLAAYRASQVSQSASEDIEKSPSPPGMGGNMLVGSVPGTSGFQAVGGSPPGTNIPVSLPGQMMGQQQQQSPPHMMHMPAQMIHQQMLMQQQMNMGPASHSPQQHSPPQQQMSPLTGPVYTSPPHVAQAGPLVMETGAFGFQDTDMNMEVTYPHCVRRGCKNHARENPAWDLEYCSNECVITHCRDIFKNWVASRPGSNSYPVK